MKVSRSAQYKLSFDETGAVTCADSPFDRRAYSQMKYGNRDTTRAFASEIARDLLSSQPDVVCEAEPPLFLVAYKEVPPACLYLSRYCLDVVNVQRNQTGLEPGEIVRVYKGDVTTTDYSRASAAEREAELQAIDFSLRGTSITDRPVVVLDDIRISGGAERKMIQIIEAEKQDPRILHLGYIAIFDEAQALEAPHVESELNASQIQTVTDLLPMIQENNFDLNIRTLKLILGSEESILATFIAEIPAELVQMIIRGSVDTGVEFTRKYLHGFTTILQVANERGIL